MRIDSVYTGKVHHLRCGRVRSGGRSKVLMSFNCFYTCASLYGILEFHPI